MANMWICLSVMILAVASTSDALSCYQCQNCEKNEQTYGGCFQGFDYCMTTTIGSEIHKSCAPKTACDSLKSIKDDTERLMDSVKNFGGSAADMPDMPTIECCQSNYCNAASGKLINNALLILVPVLAYFFRF